MHTGYFSCFLCGVQQRFRALTRNRLRRKMDRFEFVHDPQCELDHPTTKANA